MPDVFKFPPVAITAYESSIDDPMRVSVGINGAARGSQTRANRAVYMIKVSGVGDGVGRIETLKQFLKGKLPLVQVDTLPAVWFGKTRDRARRELSSTPRSWTHGDIDLDFTEGGADLVLRDFSKITSVAGNDGFDYVDVTGLPSGITVHAGEAVQGGGDVAYVVGPVVTADGIDRLYLTSAIPDGEITIGEKVTRIFRMTSRPRAIQTTGAFSYDFDMIEAFQSDYTDTFTILSPPWI
jgi:hypothetical protein